MASSEPGRAEPRFYRGEHRHGGCAELHELERTKKFRDVARTGRAAIVIDDLASTDPWRVRGIEIRGRGEAIALPTPLIRIHPERIVSWGIEPGRSARTVARC